MKMTSQPASSGRYIVTYSILGDLCRFINCSVCGSGVLGTAQKIHEVDMAGHFALEGRTTLSTTRRSLTFVPKLMGRI